MLALMLLAVAAPPQAPPPPPAPPVRIAGNPCGPDNCHVCKAARDNTEGCACRACLPPGTTGDAPPPGYGRWLSGPNAGQLFRLDAPAQPAATPVVTTPPAQSPGCRIDPRTGKVTCPLPAQRR